MRLHRPRFTVRRLMITVAMLAVLLWSGMTGTRWAEYRRLAMHHENLSRVLSGEIEAFRRVLRATPPEAVLARVQLDSAIMDRRRALDEELSQAERYRRVMQRPWLVVSPNSR